MKRPKKDPTAWRTTPEGHAKYQQARTEAQKQADAMGYDYGLEANDLMKSFHVFMLRATFRCGHKLRCEAVHPMTREPKPGHGPEATRETMQGIQW
jgi:hypothetical protein